jgi:tellurite resistance protein
VGIFDALKGALADPKKAFESFGTKQNAEAVVAIMYGAAHADGHYGDDEKKKIGNAFSLHPMLKNFPVADHVQFISSRLEDGFSFDLSVGLDACRKEVKDIKGKPYDEKAVVILAGVIAAKADGDLSGPEKVFLRSCADVAGVDYKDVGLL